MFRRDAWFIAGAGVIIGITLIYSFIGYIGRPLAVQQPNIISNTIAAGDVSIGIKFLTKINNQLTFSISVDTHSVDLSQFNLQELVTLDYNEKSIRPISTPTLSGHHTSGNLLFEINGEADDFVIKIKGIPQDLEREFKFP